MRPSPIVKHGVDLRNEIFVGEDDTLGRTLRSGGVDHHGVAVFIISTVVKNVHALLSRLLSDPLQNLFQQQELRVAIFQERVNLNAHRAQEREFHRVVFFFAHKQTRARARGFRSTSANLQKQRILRARIFQLVE